MTYEPVLVQTFVAQAAVEALDVGVLVRLARLDEMPVDAVDVGPRVERPTDELRTVVGDQHRRLPARVDQALQHLGDKPPADRSIDVNRQACPGEIVDDGEDTKAPAVVEHIENKVERPAFIDAGQRAEPGHAARYAPTSFATTDGETFLRIQPIDALEIHAKAFAPEQHVEPSIPEPSPLAGELPEAVAQRRPLRPPGSIATGRAAESHEPAGPALTQLELRLDRPHRGPLRHGRQTFFPTSSFRAWLSSVRSATRRLSRLFSCSSVRRRRASLTSRPAYLAFQR